MNAQAGGGSAPAATEPTTPGELLRRERERRALSLQQAAEDLHLDVWMIEANRFAALGAPVYAKGHLRKYATLLGLSPAFVIERYEALGDTPAVPTPIPATVALPVPRERRSLKLPLWIIAIALALAAGWGLYNGFGANGLGEWPASEAPTSAPISTRVDDSAPAAMPAADDSGTMAPGGDDGMASPESIGPDTGAAVPSDQLSADPSTPVADAGPEPTAGAVQISLHLEFSEPCWTEVYDAAGGQLMFDLGMPERPRTLTGAPPLRVTLGLAAAVTAQVDDHPIIIPRRAGRDAARFLVQADGSVSNE